MVVGCPPCYLAYARQQLPSTIGVAAQNCFKVSVWVFGLLERIEHCDLHVVAASRY